jgi:hypothetical protein
MPTPIMITLTTRIYFGFPRLMNATGPIAGGKTL